MLSESHTESLQEIEGVIRAINAPCREMHISVNDKIYRFDIAGECSVWLHGERVKLRILQVADPVHISYSQQGVDSVATQIRVLD
jgi:hypothetical protein